MRAFLFMSKRFLLLLLTISLSIFSNIEDAYARSDAKKNNRKSKNFYSKVKIGVGYELQRYTGSDVKDAFDSSDEKNRFNHAPVISLGYNLYYKLNKRFALLGGLEVQGRYTIKGKDFVSSDGGSVQYNEFLRLSAKLGFKTNLSKKVAVETYGIIGGNIALFEDIELLSAGTRDGKCTAVGLSAGAGIDFVIADKFTVGVEYRRGFTNIDIDHLSDDVSKFKMKTDSVLAKIGYQF